MKDSIDSFDYFKDREYKWAKEIKNFRHFVQKRPNHQHDNKDVLLIDPKSPESVTD
jgi:hypothetical protein